MMTQPETKSYWAIDDSWLKVVRIEAYASRDRDGRPAWCVGSTGFPLTEGVTIFEDREQARAAAVERWTGKGERFVDAARRLQEARH